MKRLIVTADDFGLCAEVNQAVIEAHRNGILTCASLMVGGEAADEAVRLARNHPSLKVGLHLTLVDGFSVLPQKEIPDLVDSGGRFSGRIVLSGIRCFFSKSVKTQMAMECEAQVRKIVDTGLSIDHLNSHNHLHIHPGIREIILPLIRKYRIPAVRLPRPAGSAPNLKSTVMAGVMAPWVSRLQRRLIRDGIFHNQEIFGLYETGAMVETAWLGIIPRIRDGTTEVYCHPAVRKSPILRRQMPSYRNEEEFHALTSPAVREQLDRVNVIRTSFTALG
jgi:hopanoid biosynthesis associated protein HpnK